MHVGRLLSISTMVVLGICPLVAEAPATTTLTISLSGTLGPLLRGSDPLNANGQSGSLAITVSESLTPTNGRANFATYTLPKGAIKGTIAGITFVTTKTSTMTINLSSTADTITVNADGPLGSIITAKAYLAPGSWPQSVVKHPTAFSPSPQNLTPAASAMSTGSKITYKVLGSTSTLGLAGTASN